MVAALGVRQRPAVHRACSSSAPSSPGWAARCSCRARSVHHAMDLQIIVETFVVVVVGGLGSVPGAYLAAVLLGELNAFGIVVFPQISLVLAFLVMAVVLVVRPWGLLGRPEAPARGAGGAVGHADPADDPRPARQRLRPRAGAGGPAGVRRRLRADGAQRGADLRAVRRQPALPDGRGRHGARSATPPTSASAPTARRWRRPSSACRWRRRRFAGPALAAAWRRWSSAGSACG